MKDYQLRLPARQTLDGWVDEVAWFVWKELTQHTSLEALDPHAFAPVREILRELLGHHVKVYRSCGVWSFCQAGTGPSPWMPPEACHPDEPNVQLYILEVAQGLEELVAQATDRITEFLFCLLGSSLPRGVIEPAIETALQRGIGRYLYDNPNCGVHPICHGRIALNPWQPVEQPEDRPWLMGLFTT